MDGAQSTPTHNRLGTIRNYIKLNEAVFLDFQFVYDAFGNRFIKELAVLEPQYFAPAVYFFKSPYRTCDTRLNRTNELCWDTGFIDYNKVREKIKKTL